MTIRILALAAILTLTGSCVEDFRPQLEDFDYLLVVDGGITNQAGPYTVKLSYATGLDINSTIPVKDAMVEIVDQDGLGEILTETSRGVYMTKNGGLQGVVGKQYKLIIRIENRHYETEYELLKASTPIESVEAKLEYKAFPTQPEAVPGIQFYLNTATSPYENDFFLWTQEGTYKYQSDLLIYFIFAGGMQEVEDHDYLQTCYRTYDIGRVFTSSTDQLSVPRVISKPLHFLPATDHKLSIRYSMLTRQFSVSRKAFEFWHSVEQQSAQNGTLYSTQPYQIRGNVRNVEDPEETVLGYFMVAGIFEHRIFINSPEEIDIILEECGLDYESVPYIFFTGPSEWPIYLTLGEGGAIALAGYGCMDCRELGGELEKPEFWIE